MASCTMYKLVINGSIVLPEIYFSWDDANQALKRICESNVSTFGRAVLYDDETGTLCS